MKVLSIEKRCLSVAELARYLGVSRAFIHQEIPRWVNDFKITVYKMGAKGKRGKYLFEKLDIDQKLLPKYQVS